MPFTRPTLTELRDAASTDITTSGLPNADGLLRMSVLRVLAWVQAGLAHLHYGYLDWIAHQSVPFTADDEYLEAWSAIVGVGRNPATAATGSATFTGTPTTPIPSGTLISRSDGYTYATTASGAIGGGGSVTVPIVAWSTALGVPATGSSGNAVDASPLTIASPISGITSLGVAETAITGGAEAESDDSLRDRMLAAFANPAHGGSAADYVAWARDVSGITRAWCSRVGAGAGTVVVYVMLDIAQAAFNGFPQGTNGVATAEPRIAPTATGDQLAVANAVFPLQPVTALVYVYAPAAQPLNFSIVGLTPDTAPIRADIAVALKDLLVRKGSPLADIAVASSDVEAAILAVAGVVSFSLGGSWPITPAFGSLLTVGTITYT